VELSSKQMHPRPGVNMRMFLSELRRLGRAPKPHSRPTGMQPRRVTEQEMFLEVKRALIRW